jgi:hypothetical protein
MILNLPRAALDSVKPIKKMPRHTIQLSHAPPHRSGSQPSISTPVAEFIDLTGVDRLKA